VELLKLTPAEFKKFAKFAYSRTGIHLPEEKCALLSNRLRKRLRALELDSFHAYYAVLSDDGRYEEELPHFLSAITTNETYFFRNEKLWALFEKELIPYFARVKSDRSRSIRIWSAAASSGAEAYTAAIVLRESLPRFSEWKVGIVASDISERVLTIAREGLYDDYAVSKMSPARVKRWFRQEEQKFRLVDDIRKMVRFQFHNLRELFRNARFDFVLLRNVLMYFDTAMKIRVLEVVSEALSPGGFLFVGDVDPIRTTAELSSVLKLEYQKPGLYFKPGVKHSGLAVEKAVTA